MYDVTIVGCGVVGASLAYTLSQYRLRVLVLERENDVAMGTTKANSAIVHAGYDPENGTLMAKLNVRGSELMEQLCSDLSVGYKRIGSFVLAFDEEQKKHLEHLLENGVRNGVPGLRILDAEEAHEMEPNLAENVAAALYAPSAAVIDPWGLCIAEAEAAVRNGVELRLRSEVTGLEDKGGHVLVHTKSGDYETKVIVNCAGGWGGDICAMTGETEWEAQPSRGEYYLLDKSSGNLVSHVIFQCPNKLGKGVLVSPTVHGNLIVGPNAVDVDAPTAGRTRLQAWTSSRRPAAEAFRRSISASPSAILQAFARTRAKATSSSARRRICRACCILPASSLPACPQRLRSQSMPPVCWRTWASSSKRRTSGTADASRSASSSSPTRRRRLSSRRTRATAVSSAAARPSPRARSSPRSTAPIPPLLASTASSAAAGSGMGRCQGGFCGPRVLDIHRA